MHALMGSAMGFSLPVSALVSALRQRNAGRSDSSIRENG